jgi:hypothetical protein
MTTQIRPQEIATVLERLPREYKQCFFVQLVGMRAVESCVVYDSQSHQCCPEAISINKHPMEDTRHIR